MPYIKQQDRDLYDGLIRDIRENLKIHNNHPGELNYIITSILCGALVDGVSYTKVNELVGVLECAKQELYSRIARPYEDMKMKENGEAYK